MLINPSHLRRRYKSYPHRQTLTLSNELMEKLKARLRMQRSSGELSNFVEQATNFYLLVTDIRHNSKEQMDGLAQAAEMLNSAVSSGVTHYPLLAALARNLSDIAEMLAEQH